MRVMKNACDLFLSPKKEEDIIEMIALSKHMHYDGIALAIDPMIRKLIPSEQPDINKRTKKLVKTTLKQMSVIFGRMSKKINMDILARVTTSWHDPFRELFKFDHPPRNIIVAFQVENAKDLRRSLKYWFPYLVSISIGDVGLIDEKIFGLSRQFYKPIEVSLRDFIYAPPPARGRILAQLQKVKEILNKKHFKIVFSSGARIPTEMRSIRTLWGVLETIGIKKEKIVNSYQLSSEFLFQPKPAVVLNEENERDHDLLQKVNMNEIETTRSRDGA